MENIFTKLMFFSIEENYSFFVFLLALMSKKCNVIFKPELVAAALTPNMHNRKEMLCQQ